MGNCVLIQKNSDPATKARCSIGSQAKSIRMGSPVKDSKVNDDPLIAEINSKKPQSLPMPSGASFRDLSNFEETYFDSQPWLDSDGEDFLSVDGDSTPSCSTTPVHQTSLAHTPGNEPLNISSEANPIPEPSPSDMKKQLFELFREGFHSDSDDGQQNLHDKVDTKHFTAHILTNGNPYGSVASSSYSSDTALRGYYKKKPSYSPQCCLPNFVRSLSFTERTRKLSPANVRRGQ